MSPETGLACFQKVQIGLSEVLGGQCFDTTAICAIAVCMKHELKAAIFKTVGGVILWQEDFKEGQCLKTVSHFSGQISGKVCLMLSSQIIDKTIHKHVTMFFAKQHFIWYFFSQKSHDFAYFCDSVTNSWLHCNASLTCVIYSKIIFQV